MTYTGIKNVYYTYLYSIISPGLFIM